MTMESKSTNAKIVCNENGPYIVKNVDQLTGTRGQSIDVKSTMALCRCGESSNKPFCDGTHGKIGFSSTLDSGPAKNAQRAYVGEEITVYDNRGLCAHAGVCVRDLDSVFRLKKSPWIDPDQASVDEIKAVVDNCPSGALSYSTGESSTRIPEGRVTITVTPNGPYTVTGNVELTGVEEFEGASSDTRTLCRCGHSRNKPYCDGAHLKAQFTDS